MSILATKWYQLVSGKILKEVPKKTERQNEAEGQNEPERQTEDTILSWLSKCPARNGGRGRGRGKESGCYHDVSYSGIAASTWGLSGSSSRRKLAGMLLPALRRRRYFV